MGIQFANAAEALAGIASVMVAADNQGSLKERQFLFEQMAKLEPFAGYTPAAFNALLGTVVTRLCDTLPTDPETMQLTPAAIGDVCAAAKQQLSLEQCAAAVRMAAQLAGSDQTTAGENALLSQLKQGLGVA
jgi:hypothetical protein